MVTTRLHNGALTPVLASLTALICGTGCVSTPQYAVRQHGVLQLPTLSPPPSLDKTLSLGVGAGLTTVVPAMATSGVESGASIARAQFNFAGEVRLTPAVGVRLLYDTVLTPGAIHYRDSATPKPAGTGHGAGLGLHLRPVDTRLAAIDVWGEVLIFALPTRVDAECTNNCAGGPASLTLDSIAWATQTSLAVSGTYRPSERFSVALFVGAKNQPFPDPNATRESTDALANPGSFVLVTGLSAEGHLNDAISLYGSVQQPWFLGAGWGPVLSLGARISLDVHFPPPQPFPSLSPATPRQAVSP